MSNLLTGTVLAPIAALLLFLASARSHPSPELPDPRIGVIGGKVALLAWPVHEDHEGKSTVLDARGCEVHLTNADAPTVEHVFPCASWFAPPTGRYLFWLEQGSLISYQTVLYYAGEPFSIAGKEFLKPMYPAGRVVLHRGGRIPADGSFRLLSLAPQGRYRPFDRQITAADAAKGVLMPVGRIIAGSFDKAGHVIDLSRSRDVAGGTTLSMSPERPDSKASALLAVLNRSVRAPFPACRAALISRRRRLEPEVSMQAYDRIVLVWYHLRDSGATELEVRCGTEALVQDVLLNKGLFTTLRTRLR